MYRFTLELVSFAGPRVEEEVLFASLAGRQAEIDRFLGVMSCAVPIDEYLSPRNLRRVIGLRGFAKVARGKMSVRRQVATSAGGPPSGTRAAAVAS